LFWGCSLGQTHEKPVGVLTSSINSETPIFTGLDYGNLIVALITENRLPQTVFKC
jgi:hypothetical protein